MLRAVRDLFRRANLKFQTVQTSQGSPGPSKNGLSRVTPWVNYQFTYQSEAEASNGYCSLLTATIKVKLGHGSAYDTPFGPSPQAITLEDWEVWKVERRDEPVRFKLFTTGKKLVPAEPRYTDITRKFDFLSPHYLELAREVEKQYKRIIAL